MYGAEYKHHASRHEGGLGSGSGSGRLFFSSLLEAQPIYQRRFSRAEHVIGTGF